MKQTPRTIQQPNTTQMPHLIIREWMPRLKDVEFRMLIVVADQTLGWLEDPATGRRKEKDWIAHTQLCKKTGRSDRAISKAAKGLIEDYKIVEAFDEAGNPLDTSEKRQMCGKKIFYRLSLRSPQRSLFDTPAHSSGVKNLRTQKVRTTKETKESTKDTPYRSEALVWNQELFKGFADAGIQIIADPHDRARYPRMLRRKNPDIQYWLRIAKFSQIYSFKDKVGEWKFPWRGAVKLSKLYYEVAQKHAEETRGRENMARLEDMKKGLIGKFAMPTN